MTTNDTQPEKPITSVDEFYGVVCKDPTDIGEHLPLLRRLAEECVKHGKTATREPSGGHITELGIRYATGSTLAFLAARPRQLISWDINPRCIIQQNCMDLLQLTKQESHPTFWQPRTGNTLDIVIEETDMIFFDTLHTARHLLKELMRHGPKARKYLAFHDTETFGMRGEDGSEPGLLAAINRFQKEYFPVWRCIENRTNNNGLIVLQRESDYEKHPWRSFWTTGEGTPDSRPEGV